MMNDLDENGKERHEPVSYFGSWLNVNDKNKVLYKTTWNSNNTVTLTSSPFIWENGKTFEHKTTMTYPEFLVFIHEKGLSPKTKSMAKEEERKIKDVVSTKTRKIQWELLITKNNRMKLVMKCW